MIRHNCSCAHFVHAKFEIEQENEALVVFKAALSFFIESLL